MVSVESDALKVSLDESDGHFQVYHKATGMTWSGPDGRLCSIRLQTAHSGPPSGYDQENLWTDLPVSPVQDVVARQDRITCVYRAYHRINTGRTSLRVEFSLTLEGADDVVLAHRVLEEDPDWTVHSVAIVDDALPITGEESYAVLPTHQGEVVPVGSG